MNQPPPIDKHTDKQTGNQIVSKGEKTHETDF